MLKCTDRQGNTLGRVVHALHVHVRPEHGNSTVGIPVGLESLEELLGVVEDSRTRIERQGAIYELFPRLAGVQSLGEAKQGLTGFDLGCTPSRSSRPRNAQHVVSLGVTLSRLVENSSGRASAQRCGQIQGYLKPVAALVSQRGRFANATPTRSTTIPVSTENYRK